MCSIWFGGSASRQTSRFFGRPFRPFGGSRGAWRCRARTGNRRADRRDSCRPNRTARLRAHRAKPRRCCAWNGPDQIARSDRWPASRFAPRAGSPRDHFRPPAKTGRRRHPRERFRDSDPAVWGAAATPFAAAGLFRIGREPTGDRLHLHQPCGTAGRRRRRIGNVVHLDAGGIRRPEHLPLPQAGQLLVLGARLCMAWQ